MTNESLIHTAFLEQNLSGMNTEILSGDRMSNDVVRTAKTFLSAVCGAGDNVGACVYVASASGGNPTVATADANLATKMPVIGIIIAKMSSTSCLVQLTGEVTLSGLTAGSTYVVGTDGLVAKSGGSNYPAAGDILQPLGIALSTTLLLLTSAVSGSAAGADYAITAASSNLTNSTTETTLASTTLKAGALKVGSIIEIEWAGITPTTNSTDTFLPKVYIGTGADILGATALDVADNNTFSGHITAVVRSVTSIFPRGSMFLGGASQNWRPVSHAAVTVADVSANDQLVKITGTWSVASASDIARLDVFRVQVK